MAVKTPVKPAEANRPGTRGWVAATMERPTALCAPSALLRSRVG